MPTQVEPGLPFALWGLCLAQQIRKGAGNPALPFDAAISRGLDQIEVAPPCVTMAAPLRMQRPHRRKAAPQRHIRDDEALTKTVKQFGRRSTQKALAHRPDMQIDDPPAKRAS